MCVCVCVCVYVCGVCVCVCVCLWCVCACVCVCVVCVCVCVHSNEVFFAPVVTGDGGNDVSMIQAANVGIGILGKVCRGSGVEKANSAMYDLPMVF